MFSIVLVCLLVSNITKTYEWITTKLMKGSRVVKGTSD